VGKASLHNQQQFFAVKGLLQVVERAIPHRQHGTLYRSEGSEEDDWEPRLRFMQS